MGFYFVSEIFFCILYSVFWGILEFGSLPVLLKSTSTPPPKNNKKAESSELYYVSWCLTPFFHRIQLRISC